jgi:hypothetical protein
MELFLCIAHTCHCIYWSALRTCRPNNYCHLTKSTFISNVPWNCRIHACKTTEIYRKILPTEKNTIQNKKNIQQFNIFFSNEICSLSIKIILLIILLYKVFFYVDFVKWQSRFEYIYCTLFLLCHSN